MSKKRIVVPGGMQIAAFKANNVPMTPAGMNLILEAALRWLSENPIVPTPEQCDVLCDNFCLNDNNGHPYNCHQYQFVIYEWQRRMFYTPPELDAAAAEEAMRVCCCIRDVVARHLGPTAEITELIRADAIAVDAFKLGQQSKEPQ